MTGPKAWEVKGVSAKARAAAQESSERSELSVGAWVDRIIKETENQTDTTPSMSGNDKDQDQSAESEILRVLENLESRIDEHTNRISEQLAPVQESVAGLEDRIRELEDTLDEPEKDIEASEDDAMIFSETGSPEPETNFGDTADDEDIDADESAGARDPDEGPNLELLQGERLFETAQLSEEDMSVADQSVKTDLEGLFDDGNHAQAGDDNIPPGAIPGPPERSRPVYLLVIAALLVAAGVGIAVFIWLELASPDIPVPTVAQTEEAPATTDSTTTTPTAEPDRPPAPPAPPQSASTEPAPPAETDEASSLPEPKLTTPPAANSEPPADKPEPAEAAPIAPPTELDTLRNAAAAGDAKAQNDLAIRYLVGRGVEQNYTEAAKWLEEAAASNIASAQYNLGVLYDSGRGVETDPVEALIWFHSAAEKGHGRAQYALAAAYAAGRGIARDQDIALKWLRRAADSNVLEAQSSLANILIASPVSRDSLTEAYFWYRVADANGDTNAADRGDQVAARLTPEERAEINRRASDFIAKNIVRNAPPAPTPSAARSTAATPPPPPSRPATSETPSAAQVREIQSLLSALGFRPGPADGAMGRQTRDAIQEYQRELGLDVDGEPSSELLAHLRQISGIGN